MMYGHTKVHENVYLGGGDSAKQIGNDCDRVFSVADGADNILTTDYYPLDTMARHGDEVFEEAVEDVADAMRRRETILVHCFQGNKRSPVVVACAMYLVSPDFDSWKEAFEYIRKRRPEIVATERLEDQADGLYG